MTNFIVIIADDMRKDLIDDLSFTRLWGTSYRNAFVANPVCCASRVSMLTGQHSARTQIYGNNYPIGGFTRWRELEGDERTLPVMLQEHGYVTGLFGKYINEYNVEDTSYVPPGWSEFMGITSGGGAYYDTKFSKDGVPFVMPPDVYLTDFLFDEGVSFITRHKDEPFFLWLTPVAPHKEHVPAERYAGAFPDAPPHRPGSFDEPYNEDKPEYYRSQPRLDQETIAQIDANHPNMRRCLLSVDEGVQRLFLTLAMNGILDDTLIWFMSDNGFQLGEHRLYGKSVPYVESTRMPLHVFWPKEASRFNGLKLAQNIDLAPTVADIVGFEGDFDGVSLFDHSYPARDWVYIEHHASGRKPAFVQAQGRRYVYTWHSTGEQEWYDLRSDPFQRRNAFYEGTLPLSLVESARDFVNDNLARLGFPPGMTSGPPSSTTIP